MKIFNANITQEAWDYFSDKLRNDIGVDEANELFRLETGIIHFFNTDNELNYLQKKLYEREFPIEGPDRAEYGDFQTNNELADRITLLLSKKEISPDIVVEPTCGKGSFIIATLKRFHSVKTIYAIEIYLPYIWESKFNILSYYIENPGANRPAIQFYHRNVFDFDFKGTILSDSQTEILIIGNPPWISSAKLGSLNSTNHPDKGNFKNQSGLDAITGKGNFDIGEYITLMMLDAFHNLNGHLALLVKNSVIKNIITDQRRSIYAISSIEKYCIDAKKEFNASVGSALLFCKLNSNPSFDCKVYDLYNPENITVKFGWTGSKFVSNKELYLHSKDFDGISAFEWRQGVKHDCSAIMELDKQNGYFVNGMNEKIDLESKLIYGLIKSSDLKNTLIKSTRKVTIITQKKTGQDTTYLETEYPLTHKYLTNHLSAFKARKSTIYKDKPLFSIFGIGDYSFKPYKVAISGLYKSFHFTLVLPEKEKPIMLDDTCYFIGFDKIEYAVYAMILLNSEKTEELLISITFPDAKRFFTKDILMRIDLFKLSLLFSQNQLSEQINYFNTKYDISVNLDLWNDFVRDMDPVKKH
jgi:hypothetical protein